MSFSIDVYFSVDKFRSGILRRVIIEQIGAFLVLPNKLCFTLSDIVSPIAIKIPEPSVRYPVSFQSVYHNSYVD